MEKKTGKFSGKIAVWGLLALLAAALVKSSWLPAGAWISRALFGARQEQAAAAFRDFCREVETGAPLGQAAAVFSQEALCGQ